MADKQTAPIEFIMDIPTLLILFPLLQEGVGVAIEGPCTVQNFLCGQLGVSNACLSQRIKSLFLNGRPVDQVEGAMVRAGDVLALSAAMPGLVGASFRRDGALAVFRSQISHRGDGSESRTREKGGLITLKLFNLLVGELGPTILASGVWIEGGRLKKIIEEYPVNWQTVFSRYIPSTAIVGKEPLTDPPGFYSPSFVRIRGIRPCSDKKTP